ncbi:hypothetical protein [Streptomyces flaveus]|uniref:hypothetical protein n=1 Tax=Streptomyces flaveus TaxID=66370 RepID=UPI00332CAC83
MDPAITAALVTTPPLSSPPQPHMPSGAPKHEPRTAGRLTRYAGSTSATRTPSSPELPGPTSVTPAV